MDIADKILEQIAHHRAEILRLESALQVVLEMGGGGKSAKGQQPLITIRKMVPMAQAQLEQPAAKPSKKDRPRMQGLEEKKRLRDGIVLAIGKAGRMNSTQLIAKFGPKKPDKSDKQAIYAMMYELRQAGIVERDEERYFSLVQQPQQMATAS